MYDKCNYFERKVECDLLPVSLGLVIPEHRMLVLTTVRPEADPPPNQESQAGHQQLGQHGGDLLSLKLEDNTIITHEKSVIVYSILLQLYISIIAHLLYLYRLKWNHSWKMLLWNWHLKPRL